MSFLQAQTSKRRQAVVDRAVESALRRAGAPLRKWAVYVDAPRDGDPYVRLYTRDELTEQGRSLYDEGYRRREILEAVSWDGNKNFEVSWITAPDGMW